MRLTVVCDEGLVLLEFIRPLKKRKQELRRFGFDPHLLIFFCFFIFYFQDERNLVGDFWEILGEEMNDFYTERREGLRC